MKVKKTFGAPAPIKVVIAAPASGDTATLVITLPDNPSNYRTLNLIPWLGRGIDAWVWACANQLRTFLASESVTPYTLAGYWRSGMRYFFEFLVTTGTGVEPQNLRPADIRHYIDWLKDRVPAYNTQKSLYGRAKSVLTALVRCGIVPDHEGLFPANPFPRSNSRMKGATPLSPTERQRLAQALRYDIVAIHNEQFKGTGRDVMVVYLLAVAIRTGANPTPLLEAARDCLRPHPFMPNMMLLELFKRRGNATKLVSLRYSRVHEGSQSIPMDGVALMRKALQLSESLLGEARPDCRGRVWLYRARRNFGSAGAVMMLTHTGLGASIANLIERHDLRNDDGDRLVLNLSRLRKTLEHRLWSLSGGDLIATAALMGHTPKVADTHYLTCTRQMRENATFVGEALPDIYRSGELVAKVVPILPSKSPTGRCKDPYYGDKAPKNGAPCDDFFACFTCTSYAIVGSPEDLHRLFSFYWFLEREMSNTRSNEWREEFRNTMRLIDRFTADRFGAGLLTSAKERARMEPLKFWAAYTLSSPWGVHG
ncbi:hypothetical protein [Comamonas thiooxydans]|uniref:hypothetical protein n=1 Tax=Comamonas thiooxydans TaxID=363952 RepID=UPI001CCBDAAD|nr:hypothetical protein [Comamonas thiooxydans]UBQ43815.1 hypothetical protein LCH15_10275 [Comamonas thiooxydans]